MTYSSIPYLLEVAKAFDDLLLFLTLTFCTSSCNLILEEEDEDDDDEEDDAAEDVCVGIRVDNWWGDEPDRVLKT